VSGRFPGLLKPWPEYCRSSAAGLGHARSPFGKNAPVESFLIRASIVVRAHRQGGIHRLLAQAIPTWLGRRIIDSNRVGCAEQSAASETAMISSRAEPERTGRRRHALRCSHPSNRRRKRCRNQPLQASGFRTVKPIPSEARSRTNDRHVTKHRLSLSV